MYTAFSDASVRGKAGIGFAIFKDCVLICECRKQVDCYESNDLEFIAVLELLKQIKQLGIKNVTIHTDSKNLVDAISQKRSINNPILKQIQTHLRRQKTTKIKWTTRKNNTYAHKLSRESSRGSIDAMTSKEFAQQKIEQINREIDKQKLDTILRKRTRIFLKCGYCKEFKPANQFRNRKNKERKCSTCEHKLSMLM